MGVWLQDMTTLSYLNEPGVLHNLRTRYTHDAIYTYTGSILIAINPFASLPHLYGQHMMEQYRGRNMGDLSPHVYAIADSAYRQMRRMDRSQSILVRLKPVHLLGTATCLAHGVEHTIFKPYMLSTFSSAMTNCAFMALS